jgi:SAM-dependent methyltransferase
MSALGKIAALHRSGLLKLAVEGQIGNWIATVGQAVGSERLMFNHFMFSGFHRGALETAPAAVEALLRFLPETRSVIDYGCGTGVYLNELARRGLSVKGYEYSARARAVARDRYGLELAPFDLSNFAGDSGHYDLSLCIEVAHYLPPALGDRLVELCSTNVRRALFSAAHPGQHGFGHTNPQPQVYWIERFKARGFRLDAGATEGLRSHLRQTLKRGFWLADNVFLVERAS